VRTTGTHGYVSVFFFNFAYLSYIQREFNKRIDPDLPFHYHTTNERYCEDQPPFDDVPEKWDPEEQPLRLHKLNINSREDSSIFVAGRSFLPTRNQTTIRQRLHRPAANLPPV